MSGRGAVAGESGSLALHSSLAGEIDHIENVKRVVARMKAIVYRRYGGPEVLGLDEVPKPVSSPSEVLVRVKAAGVNPADWQIRSGKRTSLPEPFTMIPGLDLSSVVEERGQSGLEPGIRVFGMAPLRLESANAGSYAEFVWSSRANRADV